MTHPVITATLIDREVSPHPAGSFWTGRDYVPPPALRTPASVVRQPLPRVDLKAQPQREPAAAMPLAPGANSGVPMMALAMLGPAVLGAAALPVRARHAAHQRTIAAGVASRRARIDANGYGARLWAWVTAQPGPVDHAAAQAAMPGGQAATYLARWARQGRLRVRRGPPPGGGRVRNEWVPAGREWPGEERMRDEG